MTTTAIGQSNLKTKKRTADPSPTFAKDATGFGMTTPAGERGEMKCVLRGETMRTADPSFVHRGGLLVMTTGDSCGLLGMAMSQCQRLGLALCSAKTSRAA